MDANRTSQDSGGKSQKEPHDAQPERWWHRLWRGLNKPSPIANPTQERSDFERVLDRDSATESIDAEVEYFWPPVELKFKSVNPIQHHERENVWDSFEEALRSEENHRQSGAGTSDAESQLASLRRRLVVWARDVGREIDFDDFREKLVGCEVGRGEEHITFLDEATCRAIKVTAGENYGARGIRHWVRNLRRSNELFDDDIHLVGALISPDDTLVRLVISQPFREGDTPSSVEIEAGLKERGFSRVGALAFYNPSTEEGISDAKPDNLVKLLDGTIYPIDVHLPVLNDRTKEVYDNIVRAS